MTFEQIMAEECGEAVLLDEVIDDANIDSLCYLQFLVRLQQEFDVEMPDEKIATAKTFRDLKHLFESSFIIQ